MKTRNQCLFKSILYAIMLRRRKFYFYKQKLQMFDNNNIAIPTNCSKNINVDIIGKGNNILIKDTVTGAINIFVYGDNNNITIDDNVFVYILDIFVGQNHKNFGPVHNCNVQIGKGTSFESTQIIIKNSNAKLNIGKNCMFAFNITLYHTDSHPIFNLTSNKIINKIKTLHIGNHVWIGANVTILKNSFIADDCIVGWGSVVSGKFVIEHTVIGGNPAKPIKTNVTWNYDG